MSLYVGDSTGTTRLTLWDEEIGSINKDSCTQRSDSPTVPRKAISFYLQRHAFLKLMKLVVLMSKKRKMMTFQTGPPTPCEKCSNCWRPGYADLHSSCVMDQK